MTYDTNFSMIKRILGRNLKHHIQDTKSMISDDELSHEQLKTYFSEEDLAAFVRVDLREVMKLGYLEDIQSNDQSVLYPITYSEENEAIAYALNDVKEMFNSQSKFKGD